MTTLPTIFTRANVYSEFFIKLTVSSENVEKVVKPPQKPTVRNNFNSCEITARSFSPYIITPRIKHPKTFTMSVPKGKVAGRNL